MKLILIIGPPAVGKMTVGQELERITNFKLFHNHMSLELVNKFFDFGTEEFKRLDKKIRFNIFEEVASSHLEGLIFTYVWAFDLKEDLEYIEELLEIFKSIQAEIHIIELRSNFEVRKIRNSTENRLRHKDSKRNLIQSEKNLHQYEQNYRMYSNIEEQNKYNILVIDNTSHDPKSVADHIKDKLNL